MTDFNLDEFFDQAEAWRDGDTRQIPGYLAERLFIDKARMPPLPGSGQTVTREQFQYREYIEREMERRWLAACHATPGTNMRNFTGLGNCFRNAGYNIARCERVRRPPFPGPSSGTGQNCRTRTITIEEDGRTTTRRETRCD